MNGTVTIKKVTRQEWLSEMPKLISNLKKNYNFEYNNEPSYYKIVKIPIEEKIKKDAKQYAHKIVLYKSAGVENIFYLVVFSKKNPTVYQCDEYRNEGWNTWLAIKRFAQKFDLAYKGAVKHEKLQGIEEEKNN